MFWMPHPCRLLPCSFAQEFVLESCKQQSCVPVFMREPPPPGPLPLLTPFSRHPARPPNPPAAVSAPQRAINTLWAILEKTDLMWIPVVRSWRLNERHYGALQVGWCGGSGPVEGFVFCFVRCFVRNPPFSRQATFETKPAS